MSINPRVLFVCTGNAGRSQMAQAMLRHHARSGGGAIEVESAGVQPWAALHPMATQVMARRGIDMAGQFPKSSQAVAGRRFDVVVTIGDPALRGLPHELSAPGLWQHWDIADPADADGTPDSQATFERTADAISGRLPALLALLGGIAARARRGGRVGVSTGLWPRARFDVTTHLPLIAAAGFDAIELCHYQGPHHFDPDDAAAVRELRRTCDDLGIMIWSVHSRDMGNLGSPDAGERQRQVDELHHSLDLAAALGAKVVVSHGLVIGQWPDDSAQTERLLDDSLRRLLPAALAGPASIAMENDTTGKPGRAAVDVLRRIAPYPAAAFGFVLDPGHANIAGDLPDIARHVGSRLISTHLNDNDGQDDHHWPPTEGSADWRIVQAILRDAGYAGCVMHEVQANRPGDDPAQVLQATMRHHRALWPVVTPD